MRDIAILLVDDSVTMQKVIELALKKTAYQLTKVDHCRDIAPELATKDYEGILVSAQLLKGMEPDDVNALRIKANQDELPLIVMTGSYGASKNGALKSFEGIYFLQKPFESQDLLGLLEGAIAAPKDTKKAAETTAAEPAAPAASADIPVETARRGRRAFQDLASGEQDIADSLRESAPPAAAPARRGATSFSIPPEELERMITQFLEPRMESLVQKAVDQYCARKFDSLARDVIESELRRLASERSRHLVDI